MTALAFSGSGAHLLSGSEDCTVRVWDSISTACLLTLTSCKGTWLFSHLCAGPRELRELL